MWNVCFILYVFLKIITMPVNFKMMKFIGPSSLNRSHFLDSNMNLQPEVCVESAQICRVVALVGRTCVPVRGAPGWCK